jgi:hypothetical protein
MLKRFGYLLAAILLVSFSFSSVSAQAAKPLDFYGNNLSDWVTISLGSSGSNYIWNILRNENPSPPGPGQATIARVPWGINQLGEYDETGDFLTAFGDYTGDGRSDLVVYRPSTNPAMNNYWIQPFPNGTPFTIEWGVASDYNWLAGFPDLGVTGGVEGDYDGDGKMDPAIVRNNGGAAQWWILNSSTMTLHPVFNFGNYNTDFFLPGADYNADGKADPATFRVAEDGAVTWYVGNTNGVQLRQVQWGNYNTDYIIPSGDYDGDGRADFMVWRAFGADRIWYLLTNTGNIQRFWWGTPSTDYPLRSGDYDGDGKTDVAIWRASTQTFWVRRSGSANPQNEPMIQRWGNVDDFPLASFGIF